MEVVFFIFPHMQISISSIYLPVRKTNATMSKRGESSNNRVIWRRAKYVGIKPPTWEIAVTLANSKILRRIAKMRVKELTYYHSPVIQLLLNAPAENMGTNILYQLYILGIRSRCIWVIEATNPATSFLEQVGWKGWRIGRALRTKSTHLTKLTWLVHARSDLCRSNI